MQSKIITIQSVLSDQLVKALPPLYSTDNVPLEDQLVICKFHMPTESIDWVWYVFEGSRLDDYERGTDGCLIKNDYQFFGMVHGFENEMGYFLLSELLDLRDTQSSKLLVQLDPAIFLEPYSKFIEKTIKEAEEKTADKEYLTFKEWMLNQFDRDELSDICTHGANAGWPGLIYYSDTNNLYEKYSEDIWEMLYEDYQSHGSASCLELINSFSSVKDVNSDDQFKNLLVWYAAERIAFEITECDETDTE